MRNRWWVGAMIAATLGGVPVLSGAAAVGEVRQGMRTRIQPVTVPAEQLVEINRRMKGLPRRPRTVRATPKPGIQVYGRPGSALRLRAKLNLSSVADANRVVPAPGPAVSAPLELDNRFLGLLDDLSSNPPDTHGAVGPDHVMTMLNTQVNIQTKTGVDVSGWPVDLRAFWAPTGVGNGFFFDPRIVYDSNAGQWMATVLSDSAAHLAIHPGPDPSSGSWSYFNLPFDGVNYPDFPDIGCNANWIAITAVMFPFDCGPLAGSAMWVIERPVPPAGPAVVHTFPVGFDSVGGVFGVALRPCLTFDAVDTLYIVDNSNVVDGATGVALLRLSRISGPANAPVWSVQPGSDYGSSGLFPVPAANDFLFDPPDATQLGTSAKLVIYHADMLDAVFRNGHVWCTHNGGYPVPDNTQCSSFWYELDPEQMPAPIVQAGVVDGGTGVHHCYPSLAVDASGNMVIGFTRSHSGIYAQAAFAVHGAGMGPGAVGPVQTLKAGLDIFDRYRWGDYSATVIDPVDDTFWTLQEYAAGRLRTSTRWGTWWGHIAPTVSVLFQEFRAEAIEGAVELTWRILADEPFVGFDVYRRGHSATEEFAVVNDGQRLAADDRRYVDTEVSPGVTYDYMIIALRPDGPDIRSATVRVTAAALEVSLAQNYPNPFNPKTSIRYVLPERRHVMLQVFDARGALVKVLEDRILAPGRHEVIWDGDNDLGGPVTSGLYFYRLRVGNKVLTRKMVLVK